MFPNQSYYFNRPNRPGRPGRPNFPNNNDRFGFLGPFILGGITGGLLAPNFYPKPYYYPPYPPYYYGPYYR